MTEQHEGEHEWVPRVLGWEDVDGARCNILFCDAQMDDKEMSRRLNEYGPLKELEKACIRLYVGEITKPAWREFVRRSPEGQLLIALANREEGK